MPGPNSNQKQVIGSDQQNYADFSSVGIKGASPSAGVPAAVAKTATSQVKSVHGFIAGTSVVVDIDLSK